MNRIISSCSFLLVVFIVFSCSSNRPLLSRGLNSEERRHYIIQNGYGISKEVSQSFIEGIPQVGMDQDLIFQLFSAPDRTANQDTKWEYVNNRGELVTGFKFEDKKVIEIYGDPRGGLPVPEGSN